MVTTHNLGYPRIGRQRELKFALEKYWNTDLSQQELLRIADELRVSNWQDQKGLVDMIPVGDFSLYDHVLDTSALLGNLPERARAGSDDKLQAYFKAARGRAVNHAAPCCATSAAEMTKWFDTNYHYLVPEFDQTTRFRLEAANLISQVRQAQRSGVAVKPVLIGPLTYLWLGKAAAGFDRLSLLAQLTAVYAELLEELAGQGVQWVQMDEPILVTDLDPEWRAAFQTAYQVLGAKDVRLLLSTYFGELAENLELVCSLDVDGVHLDTTRARHEVETLVATLPADRIVSLGVIDGRNIWKSDLHELLNWLEPLHHVLGERLWIAPSCSLLHVPVDLEMEKSLDGELKSWLCFARQKLQELHLLGLALNKGRVAVQAELVHNQACIAARRRSSRVHDETVSQAMACVARQAVQRSQPHDIRKILQNQLLDLPLLPTTTIGSFPQTTAVRQVRLAYRLGEIDQATYEAQIRAEIRKCIELQEAIGLDVLVHGEAERNDMVEYFAQHLKGFAFTEAGWVQSYGSRCVKPPIIYGDVSRPEAITVDWICYAQSLTSKPVKGMLTGPVTLLNWSFVRDDQPRESTCMQLALAIRQEVIDLERAGVSIIQIDEAALREGLALRKRHWSEQLGWAVRAFRLASGAAAPATQIHTHMCYSEFNDIIEAIAALDADVITIECARSSMTLLEAFEHFDYPNDIGPGVFDIHSPNVPSVQEISHTLQETLCHVEPQKLWINPDCGLKTRQWEEALPALRNMVQAAHMIRKTYQNTATPLQTN